MSESPRAKKIKKSEDDVLELLSKYSTTTILSVLHEIHEYTVNHPDSVEIDWMQLCKSTCTGISNAREYQMLWRNLAYQHPIMDVKNGAEVMDDDSDLEIEIEADPQPTAEEELNAKECVKALLSSAIPHLNSVDEDMHNGSPLLDSPDKQKLVQTVDEGMDGNGHFNGKKKRQPWTKEEDDDLIELVKKHGEGNWTSIPKCDFKHSRTPSQLSQRWTLLRKKGCSANNGDGAKCSSLSMNDERLAATQKAISMAIDMPMTGSKSMYSLSQSQNKTAPNIFRKSHPLLKKTSYPTTKHTPKPNSLIQAAALAAGGRIANPSTAASLLKAAQSKNAVRIGTGHQICQSVPNNSSTNASASESILPSSTPASSGSSFGTTLSSIKPVNSKDEAAENAEKKIAASDNSNDGTLNEERAAKESNVGETEIVFEKEITPAAMTLENEVKKSKNNGIQESKETADMDKQKESRQENSVTKDSQTVVDEKK